MHSAMYHYLLQAGMLTFSSETLSTGEEIKWGGGGIGLTTRDVAYFAGMRIIVTDNIEPVAGGTTGAPEQVPRLYVLRRRNRRRCTTRAED